MTPSHRPDTNTILILGSPRSGTTWLAKLFDSHENVLYRHEPDIYLKDNAIPFMPDPEHLSDLKDHVKDYLRKLMDVRSVKAAGSLPTFRKSYRTTGLERTREGIINLARVLEYILGRFNVEFRFQIPDFTNNSGEQRPTMVIKSVSSLGRTFLFSSALPEAKIVHIIRHPCAVVCSRLRGKQLNLMEDDAFIDTQAKLPQAVKHLLTTEKLQSMTHEQQLASFWMLQNEKVMEEMGQNPNYRVVVYEELCKNPEKVCKELFEFTGLEWSKQTEQFIDLASRQESGSERYYQIIRNPLQSINKWQKELNPNQIGLIAETVRTSLPGSLFYPSS